MQSCRARLEAKIYVVRTGQIIAADGKYGSAIDISESIAAKKALSSAGQQMGEYFVEQLLNLGSGNRQGLQVVVIGSDFSKVTKVIPFERAVAIIKASAFLANSSFAAAV